MYTCAYTSEYVVAVKKETQGRVTKFLWRVRDSDNKRELDFGCTTNKTAALRAADYAIKRLLEQ